MWTHSNYYCTVLVEAIICLKLKKQYKYETQAENNELSNKKNAKLDK